MLEAPDNDDDEFASRNHTVGLTYSINSDMIIDDNLSEDDLAKLTKALKFTIGQVTYERHSTDHTNRR